ncbi:MAG TPA: hypothetical protein VMV53_10810 [Acidimicrobiales bacterium]|nr:hypothetical protein [Acidimicrobiales bacterium]
MTTNIEWSRRFSDEFDEGGPRHAGLAAWFRPRSAGLPSALEEAGEQSACWTWWGEPASSGAVAAIRSKGPPPHREDAQLALSTPGTLGLRGSEKSRRALLDSVDLT